MELSNQQNDALQVHELYWKSYITGDINTLASLLDEHYTQVGSVEGEVFHNKKDAVRFIEETIDQINGKVDMRNRITKLDKVDHLILVSERCDLYALIDNTWTFYAKFRASTLLHEKNGKWLIIHQHSSMPDTRAEEGENIALDKIAAENLQLKEAVKRRTIELEHQNRELEIEAALERVRARTMAMHHSSELADTATILIQQIKKLGFEIWSCGFGIWRPEVDLEESWMSTGDLFPIILVPFKEDPTHLSIYEASQRGESVFEAEVKGEVLTRHYDWLMSQPSFKIAFDQIENSGIILPTVQYKYAAFFKQGYLHLITTKPQPDIHHINRRFAKVFEQTYTRFLDLQKAEAQAREAKIEVALERIRASAMAMHSSEGILEVTQVLREQIALLGEKELESILVHIYHEDIDQFEAWYSYRHPENKHEPIRHGKQLLSWSQTARARKDKEKYYEEATDYTLVADNRMLKEWYDYLLTMVPEVVEVDKEGKPLVPNVLYYNYSKIAGGSLLLITNSEASDHSKYLLRRAATVFNLAYSRFLDLQKAEAQAREAQIEAALERVRSRTMAMQRSEELPEVAALLFQQVKALGVPQFHCGFNIFEIDDKECIWYPGSADGHIMPPCKIPLTEHPVFMNFIESRKRGDELCVYEKGGEYQAGHYRYMLSLPVLGEMLQNMLDAGIPFPTFQIDHLANFSHGNLLFITSEHFPEMHDTFKRFAKVFEQTYTRFLDLQKAEAQAREAQIQLALERVRARTMAMQHSSELKDSATLLFKQVLALGIPAFSCGYNIWEKDEMECASWMSNMADDSGISLSKKIPLTEDPNFIRFHESRQKGEDFYVLEMSGERMQEHFRYLWKTIPEFDEAFRAMEKAGIPLPEKQVHHIANFSHGNLMFITLEPCPEAHDIFKRFASVFEQTYTRFLDLQKAEAMAKEAQVEVALERVRARAMAMQSSEELIEVADVMREQLGKLGQPELETSVIHLYPDQGDTFDSWYVLPAIISGQLIKGRAKIAKKGAVLVEEMISKFKSTETEYTLEASGEKLTEWMGHMKKYLPEVYENSILVNNPQKTFYRFSDFSGGSLIMVTFKEPSAEACNFQKRAAKVFDLAYQRFLDLKNAEAQARESQIQLALERVRARTMAMQRSEELPDAANLLFHQLQNLGMPAWSAGYCTWAENKKSITLWMSSEGVLQPPFNAPLTEDPSFIHMLDAHEAGKELHIEAVGGNDLVNHYKYMRTLPVVGDILDSIIEAGHPLPTFQIIHCAYFSKGFLLFITYEPVPLAHEIFIRFAKVFEQTYTRFLDLKQAEQQAREAQIEVSLERVRARAMAMQNSDELRELIGTVFTELTRLDISLTRTLIMINDPETLDSMWWMANSEAPTQPMGFPVQYHEYPPYMAYIKAWKQKEVKFLYVLEGQDKVDWDNFIFSETGLVNLPDFVIAGMRAPERVFLHVSFNNFGNLTLASLNPLPDEHFDILLRFAKVFDLTYTRFNDLRIAEARAREARIEASLERVRSKAMAMHSSEDLAATIKVFFHEIETISITPRRCGVGLLNKETRMAELSTMNTTDGGNIVEVIGRIEMINHPVLEAVYNHWIDQQEYHPVLRGNEINEYYKLLKPQISIPEYPHDAVQYGYFFFFPEGGVYAWTNQELPEDELQCYRRFTSVLSLTYKRYKDLKNAELQAHKAQIETALERVRARALAMQQPEELIEVSEVLRYEMGLLGVEELETCSIYLNDETTGKTDCWYAIKDLRTSNKKLASDHFVLELKDTWVGREMLKFYMSSHKKTSIVMKGEARKEWIHYCEDRSAVLKGYYGTEIPERTYHLYKFSQGAIGVASAGEISHESWDLLQRAASVFSLAYSRFKDLTNARLDLFRLKEEKQRAETALTELKSAQAQLIQAEKMASLGELTAGIAHEIQNPLNFVNNFSELSGELIREMEEELEKGNKQEAKTLAEDIQSNLEKINYHGRRADAIVKGMLLHSRTSRGDKEDTDINALADEFLRLAYHGMRAKEHSFNADMHTSFDPSIGKVKINRQDMGRVLLNLFNNAFYAVGEKKKLNGDYEPLVTVTTKLSGNHIELDVKDNGLGIPEKVKEKIFQPFFTTKPTGEGTGLGLSLSYDIITKGHSGSIKVDTIEQAGTTFTIQIPIELKT